MCRKKCTHYIIRESCEQVMCLELICCCVNDNKIQNKQIYFVLLQSLMRGATAQHVTFPYHNLFVLQVLNVLKKLQKSNQSDFFVRKKMFSFHFIALTKFFYIYTCCKCQNRKVMRHELHIDFYRT